MKTIELIVQHTYGIVRCVLCSHHKMYESVNKRTGKPRATSMTMLKTWAHEDGWRKNKRGQWCCPSCAQREGLA